MPEALDLLKTRRSVKPIELNGPGPSAAELESLLTVASRVPDHGKLTPWRFIVFDGDARLKAGTAIEAIFKADNPAATADQIAFERNRLARAPLVIAVVSRAGPHVKIPEWEQVLSAGAAAMNLGHGRACARLRGELDHRVVRLRPARARCAGLGAAREDRRLRPYRPSGEAAGRPAASAALRHRDEVLMFYSTDKNDHGLPHDPFKAIIAPRPIGWITSMSASGAINLAPYSYFNGVRSKPPMVMFASETRKDSQAFIEETKEFVCNLATWDLREQMNQTSAPYPRGVNELEEAGLTAAPCRLVKPPRVAEAPCALECKYVQTVPLQDHHGNPIEGFIIIGLVVGVHIDERYIRNGLLDSAAMKPIARGGYHDYSVLDKSFTMRRPTSVTETKALAETKAG